MSLLPKSPEIAKVQLAVSGHLSASAMLASFPTRLFANSTDSAASHLAPPFVSSTPVYKQISVLRI